MSFKSHKMVFFSRKKKISVPTLLKIFRPKPETLIFLFGLKNNFERKIVFFIHQSKMFLVLKRTISLCTQNFFKKRT